METVTQSTINSYPDDITINAIAEKVKRGECILFLGAGVHYPPPDDNPTFDYPSAERPPLGSTLSKHLAQQINLLNTHQNEDASNLQRVSLFYEKELSRNSLVTEIKNQVSTGKKPSPAVRALAELDFPLVITTNYDQLFETALRNANKNPQIVTYTAEEHLETKDCRDYDANRPFVYKIHGDIDIPQSIVVTDEDYIQFVLRMSDKDIFHPVPETFRYQFKRLPTLFIGYSLLDYNLRLLFKTLRWKVDKANFPEAYSVGPKPDPLIVDVWQNQRRYVKFVVQDLWTFIPLLYSKVKGKEMSL